MKKESVNRKSYKKISATRRGSAEKRTTSWGGVSDWYDTHLEAGDDTYQKQVILPNLLRVLDIRGGERVLDIGCGQGFFSREIARLGARVDGADISPELIALARERSPDTITFHVASADRLTFAQGGEYDIAISVLALQNMERMDGAIAEARRVLAPGGRFLAVLNHPAFRIPKQSSWGWDEAINMQYRRVDGYLSARRAEIAMNPGKKKAGDLVTYSYHHSLQDIFKMLVKKGFAVVKLEEWISHRMSGAGPRQKAEDTARKEFPLFLMIEAIVLK